MQLTYRDLVRATSAEHRSGPRDVTLTGVSTDSRTIGRGELFLALDGATFEGARFVPDALARGAAAVLACARAGLPPSGGVSIASVSDTRAALGALGAWHRGRLSAEVIGITGSCGKTTTKNMLVTLLARHRRTVGSPASFNNDIGVPLSLFRASESQAASPTEILVLEIGTNAPGEVEALCRIARPTIGVLTGIAASHLAGLGSIEGVAKEKGALVEAVSAEGTVVLPATTRFLPQLRARAAAPVTTFAVEAAADLVATELAFDGEGTSFRLNGSARLHLPLLGEHMVHNLLAALGAGVALGLDLEALTADLAQLQDGPGRLQRREVAGVLFLDDTYNANPESVGASVRVLSGMTQYARRVLVLGEMHELGEHSSTLHRETGHAVAAGAVDRLITIGPRARALAEGALEAGMDAACVTVCDELSAAQQQLSDLLVTGDVVLVKGSRAAGLDVLVARLEDARRRGVQTTTSSGETVGLPPD